MTRGIFHVRGVTRKSVAQSCEFGSEPGLRRQIAPQAAGGKQAPQKAAAGEARVELLGLLLKQFALGFADLQRRGVTEMAEIVQVVVKALHLGQQQTQEIRARRNGALRGGFDGLTISERMRDAADT